MDERAGSDGRRPGGSGLLIFDGDCGFCTWAAEWAERQLPSDGGTRPWQLMEDELPSYGLTPEHVSAAVYWVDPEGRAHRGHRGIGRSSGRSEAPGPRWGRSWKRRS